MKTFIEWMEGKNGHTFRGNMREKDNSYIQSEVEKYADSELNLFAIPDVSQQRELLRAFYKYSCEHGRIGYMDGDKMIDKFLALNCD